MTGDSIQEARLIGATLVHRTCMRNYIKKERVLTRNEKFPPLAHAHTHARTHARTQASRKHQCSLSLPLFLTVSRIYFFFLSSSLVSINYTVHLSLIFLCVSFARLTRRVKRNFFMGISRSRQFPQGNHALRDGGATNTRTAHGFNRPRSSCSRSIGPFLDRTVEEVTILDCGKVSLSVGRKVAGFVLSIKTFR